MKTISVKFPPSNNPVTSEQDAITLRNHRVDKLLSDALESGRITQLDIDEYNELYARLLQSSDPTERAEILTRLSSIDGSTDASTNSSASASTDASTDASTIRCGDRGEGRAVGEVETVITTDLDITGHLKYFKP